MVHVLFDLVIKGGTCFDGLGSEGAMADVAVSDGTVVEIGRVDGQARQVIDASERYVAPGFVDGHTHLDAQLFWDPWAGSLVAHGVTSAVMGNCGFTLAPGGEDQADLIVRSIERAEDMSRAAIQRGVPWCWTTFIGYMDAVEALPKALNVAAQIGHSALRAAVMGERAFSEPATDDDLARMAQAVGEAVAAGCWGFSTSRSYNHVTRSGVPVASRVATWEEVTRLVIAMAAQGSGIFQLAPERPADPGEMAGFQARLASLVVRSGRPVTFMVGGQEEQFGTVEAVVAAGGAAAGQVHVRAFENIFGFRTRLPFDGLPLWRSVRSEPHQAQRALLSDAELRHRLVAEAESGEYGRTVGAEVRAPQFDLITVIGDPGEPEPSVADVAKAKGCSPVEVMIELALASGLDQLFRQPLFHLPDSFVLDSLRRPHTVVAASDSGAHISQLLDSNIPTYLLAHWVRSTGTFSWPEAIHMLTGAPAAVWGLEGRGVLREGSHADIVVFDPATIGPAAPKVVDDLPDGGPRLADGALGIRSIIVNGEEALADGQPTGATPGILLRR